MSSELKPEIKTLADKLRAGMKVEEGGVIVAEKGLYESTLPDGMTMDTVKQVYGHTEDLVAAMTLATGEIAEPVMKKDKKLDSMSSELKLGRFGSVGVNYAREVTRPVRNLHDPSQPAVDRTTYGVTTARVKLGAQKNKGELKKVRTMLSDRAAKLFS